MTPLALWKGAVSAFVAITAALLAGTVAGVAAGVGYTFFKLIDRLLP